MRLRPSPLLFFPLSLLASLALAAPSLLIEAATPAIGALSTRSGIAAPQGNILSFDTQADFASTTNGFAKAAVAKDVIGGWPTIHAEAFANDGMYGNGSSWIAASADSWLKIDLGRTVMVDGIKLGRDRTGNYDDRDPGRFQVQLANTDDVYASGNAQNDATEYITVADSDALGFSGAIEGAQTLHISFPATSARYVKVLVTSGETALDEIEVSGTADAAVAVVTEANACTTAPCGELATCTDLPGADTSAAGRSCSCSGNYAFDASGNCMPTSPINISIATELPTDSASYKVLVAIGQKWASVSSNMVQLKVTGGSTAGTEDDMVKKLRLGTIQGAMLTTWGLHTITPEPLALNIPGLVRTHNEREQVLTTVGPSIEAALDAKGYTVLAWGELGATHVFSTVARPTVAAMQQAKFFAPNGDSLWSNALKSLQFNVFALATSDMMPSLQTGAVDAVPLTPTAAYSKGVYSKATFMSDLVWSTLDQAFIVNKNTWNTIPPSLQKTLLSVTKTAGPSLKVGVTEESKGISLLKAKGVQVTSFTDSTAWYSLLESQYAAKFRGALVPAATFDAVQKAAKEYRAAHP